MVRAMLAAERLPDDLQARLVSKAAATRSSSRKSSSRSARPGNSRVRWFLTRDRDLIQGVDIAARIDRLPETSKRALQVASVIGRDVQWPPSRS